MAYLGDLYLRVVTEENINKSNQVTERPVEQGADIIDHIDHQPVKFDITAYIIGDDAQDQYDRLLEMADADEVFEYYPEQRLDSFPNMAIENVSIPKTAKISNGFEVRLTIKQVRIVEQKAAYATIGNDPATDKKPNTAAMKTDDKQPGTEKVDENTVPTSIMSKMTGLGSVIPGTG